MSSICSSYRQTNIYVFIFVIVFQYFIVNNKDQTAKVIDTVKLPTCTHLDQKDNVTLRGGIKAGKFTKHGVAQDMKTCIDACCQVKKCFNFFPFLLGFVYNRNHRNYMYIHQIIVLILQ